MQVTPNYASTTNPYSGSDCISLLLFSGAEMIVASNGTPDISQYGGVDFYHRTNAGSLTLVVQLRDSTQTIGNAVKVSVTTTWTNAHFTLADFGLNQNSGTIVGIQFGTSSLNVPGMALDQITLFDATILDAGLDGSILDAGPIDAGAIDASTTDASTTDASTTDATTTPDAAIDAASDAASKQDSPSVDDASKSDAGSEPPEIASGCSCDLAAPSGYASAIPLALVALALIARRRSS